LGFIVVTHSDFIGSKDYVKLPKIRSMQQSVATLRSQQNVNVPALANSRNVELHWTPSRSCVLGTGTVSTTSTSAVMSKSRISFNN